MAIKTFINGQENGVITFKGDTEPCAVYVDGERQDNISYIPQEVTGENSVEYSSEYKKNMRTMQMDGNTEQFQGTIEPVSVDISSLEYTSGSLPVLASTTAISTINGLDCNIVIEKTGTEELDSFYIIVVAQTQEALLQGGAYETIYEQGTGSTSVLVNNNFYIGISNPLTGGISDNDTYWNFFKNNFTVRLELENPQVPNPEYPQPIQNAGDNGLSLNLHGKNLFILDNLVRKDAYYINNDGQELTSRFVGYTENFIPISPNKNYSCSSLGKGDGSATGIYFYDFNKNWISRNTSTDFNGKFTTPNNCYYIRLQYKFLGADNFTIVDFNTFMLNEGNTLLPYEKGFGETIELPKTVELPTLATAQQVYEKASQYTELVLDGRNCIRFSDISNATYVIEGGFKEKTAYSVTFDFKITTSNTSAPTQSASIFRIRYTDGTFANMAISGDCDWTRRTLVSDPSKTIQHIGTESYNYAKNIYIDVDTFAFQENTNAQRNLELNFAKIGTETDSIVIDRVNNKVIVSKPTNKLVFNTGFEFSNIGRENVNADYETQQFYCYISPPSLTTGYQQYKCSHFIYNNATTNGNVIGFKLVSNKLSLGVPKSILVPYGFVEDNGASYTTSLRAWLQAQAQAGTPLTVEYLMSTVEYDITDTEIGQALLNLPTQNQTNVIEITSTPSVSQLSVNYAKYGGTQ